MVLSYLRLRAPLDDAMHRFGAWLGKPELAPPRLVSARESVDAALGADDDWLGYAVWVYSAREWTIFEELAGGVSSRPATEWLSLAAGGDLVYVAANDAIGYTEIIVIERGRIVREFLQDEQDPSADKDIGRIPGDPLEPFEDWIGAMSWVETDESRLSPPAEGLLWIFHDASGQNDPTGEI